MIRTLSGGLLPTSLSDVAVGLLMFVSLSIFKIFCIDHRSRGRETSMKFNFFGSSQIHIPTSKTNSILKSGIRMFSRKKIAEKFIIHETSRTRGENEASAEKFILKFEIHESQRWSESSAHHPSQKWKSSTTGAAKAAHNFFFSCVSKHKRGDLPSIS